MKRTAHILSIILHPVFVPMYLITYLLWIEPVMSLYFSGAARRLLLALLLNLVIGPISSLWLLRRQGTIDDLSMPEKKGRSTAYLVVAGWFVLTYILVLRLDMPLVIQALFIALISCLVTLALVNRWHKASAHVAAIAGCLAVVTWMMVYYDIWYITHWFAWALLTGLVASLRLYQQAHDMKEVTIGLFIGLISVGTVMWLMVP